MLIWMLNMGKETFCQKYQQAKQLVKYLKYIAKKIKRKLTIIISLMQQPLGKAISKSYLNKICYSFSFRQC